MYFSQIYLRKFLALFPNAVILAAGGKARERLKRIGAACETCWAFAGPACIIDPQKARDSWRAAGLAIAKRLAAQAASAEQT